MQVQLQTAKVLQNNLRIGQPLAVVRMARLSQCSVSACQCDRYGRADPGAE